MTHLSQNATLISKNPVLPVLRLYRIFSNFNLIFISDASSPVLPVVNSEQNSYHNI